MAELTQMTSSVPTDEADLELLLEEGSARSILARLRDTEEALEEGKGKAARIAMVSSYAIALIARSNNDVWTEICTDPAWQGFRQRPKIKDQPNALRYVIRLSVGFRGVADNSIVSKRFAAMRPSFERGEAPSQLKDRLDELGGAEALAAWEKARDPKRRPRGDASSSGRVITIRLTGSQLENFERFPLFQDFRLVITDCQIKTKSIRAKALMVKPYLRLKYLSSP